MNKIIGITTALIIVVLSLAYLYFSNLNNKSRSNDRILSEIPADASIIFQYPNDKSLYDIFKDYTLFDTIIGTQYKSELSWLKKIQSDYQKLASLTEGQRVFLSFHPSKTDSVSFLWSLVVKDKLNIEKLQLLLKEKPEIKIAAKNKSEHSILELISPILKRPFYVCIDKGIMRASFSVDLIQKTLDLDSKKISIEFIKAINAGLKKDDNALANLFINYEKPGILKPYFRRALSQNLEFFESFRGYSSLELNFKSDVMMFNGTTRTSHEMSSYINIFLNQKPVQNTIKRVMPYNTSSSITYGISDYPGFKNDLNELFSSRKELDTLNKQLELVLSETGINAKRDMTPLWNNEFSTLHLSTFENLGIIKVKDGTKLQFLLAPLSSNYSESIRKMNYSNLFYSFFGDPLKKYSKPFFTIIDNLLILSNSAVSINRFLNDYNYERLIYRSDAYTQFDQLVADQSNISFTIYLSNARSLLNSSLRKGYSSNFSSSRYGFKDLYAISYQLSSNKDYFFTNFYTGYKDIRLTPDPQLFVDSLKALNTE